MEKILIDTSGGQLTAHIGKLNEPGCAYATGMVEGNTLSILDVWVPPEMRKKGLGRKLVKRLEKEAGTEKTLAYGVVSSAKDFWTTLGIKEIPK